MAETTVSAIRLEIIIGATFSTTILWRDEAGELVPFPPGTTAQAKVRPYLSHDDVLITFLTTPVLPIDGLITLSSPGSTTLSLISTQTALLRPVSDAVFDIRYLMGGTQAIVKLDNGQGLVDIRHPSTR